MRLALPEPAPLEEDESIVFPNIHEQAAVHVGSSGAPYELEGVVLKAIMVATNHFRPLSAEEQPCWARQEAYRYRVIRQENVIFVEISEDLEFCGMDYISLDSGATYAISVDGRILRRITGAHPDRVVRAPAFDAGFPQEHDGGASAPPTVPSPASPYTPDGGAPQAP
jgi:hypothetical protein